MSNFKEFEGDFINLDNVVRISLYQNDKGYRISLEFLTADITAGGFCSYNGDKFYKTRDEAVSVINKMID